MIATHLQLNVNPFRGAQWDQFLVQDRSDLARVGLQTPRANPTAADPNGEVFGVVEKQRAASLVLLLSIFSCDIIREFAMQRGANQDRFVT